jgi:hypothetical protein
MTHKKRLRSPAMNYTYQETIAYKDTDITKQDKWVFKDTVQKLM